MQHAITVGDMVQWSMFFAGMIFFLGGIMVKLVSMAGDDVEAAVGNAASIAALFIGGLMVVGAMFVHGG